MNWWISAEEEEEGKEQEFKGFKLKWNEKWGRKDGEELSFAEHFAHFQQP